MRGENQNKKPIQKSISFLILIYFSFFVVGCPSSYKEQQLKRDVQIKAKKEVLRKKEENIKLLCKQMAEKYNATSFPPDTLKSSVFTYELQQALSAVKNRIFLFKGHLNDIEKTDQGIVVEFFCPVGETLYINEIIVCFRLTIVGENAKQFLAINQKNRFSDDYYDLYNPDYLIVAKIIGLKKIKRYELTGSAYEDETVEINIEIVPHFISTGELIKVIKLPKD